MSILNIRLNAIYIKLKSIDDLAKLKYVKVSRKRNNDGENITTLTKLKRFNNPEILHEEVRLKQSECHQIYIGRGVSYDDIRRNIHDIFNMDGLGAMYPELTKMMLSNSLWCIAIGIYINKKASLLKLHSNEDLAELRTYCAKYAKSYQTDMIPCNVYIPLYIPSYDRNLIITSFKDDAIAAMYQHACYFYSEYCLSLFVYQLANNMTDYNDKFKDDIYKMFKTMFDTHGIYVEDGGVTFKKHLEKICKKVVAEREEYIKKLLSEDVTPNTNDTQYKLPDDDDKPKSNNLKKKSIKHNRGGEGTIKYEDVEVEIDYQSILGSNEPNIQSIQQASKSSKKKKNRRIRNRHNRSTDTSLSPISDIESPQSDSHDTEDIANTNIIENNDSDICGTLNSDKDKEVIEDIVDKLVEIISSDSEDILNSDISKKISTDIIMKSDQIDNVIESESKSNIKDECDSNVITSSKSDDTIHINNVSADSNIQSNIYCNTSSNIKVDQDANPYKFTKANTDKIKQHRNYRNKKEPVYYDSNSYMNHHNIQNTSHLPNQQTQYSNSTNMIYQYQMHIYQSYCLLSPLSITYNDPVRIAILNNINLIMTDYLLCNNDLPMCYSDANMYNMTYARYISKLHILVDIMAQKQDNSHMNIISNDMLVDLANLYLFLHKSCPQ